MTETSVKRKTGIIGRLLKYMLFASIFFVVIFAVLARIGGSEDVHRQMIEEYISEFTGYKASIGTFNSLNFFPLVIIDFENAELREPPPKAQDEDGEYFPDPVIYVKKAFLAASFWDVVFRTGKIQALKLEELYAIPGSVIEDPFTLEALEFKEEESGETFLEARGAFASAPYTMRKKTTTFGERPHQSYRIDHASPFQILIGDSAATITLENITESVDDPALKIIGTIQSATMSDNDLKPDSKLNKNLQTLWQKINARQEDVRVESEITLERNNGEKVPLVFENGLLSKKP